MKVVAFNGSPRKNGNTSIAISIIFEQLQNEGINTEMIQVGGMDIKGCRACLKCRQKKDGFCYGYENDNDDILNDCARKIYEAEGLIIASPVYFGSVTPETKALIDRVGYIARSADNGNTLKRKVGAGIAVVRRQGAGAVLSQINNLFALSEVIVPYSSYWNMAIGKEKGEILNDAEGVSTFKKLGENMAWLLKKLF
jgi:multimeric flavodoxin WrbA